MEELKSFLTQLLLINEEEWNEFTEILAEKTFNAKAQLVSQGAIAREVYLVNKGLLRAYHLLDGKEVNTYFACDGQFISTFASVITEKPSHEILEAIEDTTVFAISTKKIDQLCIKFPKFEKLRRYTAEQNYLCIVNRNFILQTKTATEKYETFLQSNPQKIIQNVPQHHIASFLGIAPESLSRVRKTLALS